MTRSIFDPAGSQTEHSGSTFTPPDAEQISHLPEQFTNPPAPQPTGMVDFVPPPETPAIVVREENGGSLLVVKLTGKLHKEDYRAFTPFVERAVQRNLKIRLLVEMHHFHGWDAGGLWEDVKFDVKHFADIEKIAIVGDAKWLKWMAAFCKPFTMAKIEYFPIEKATEARAWIAES